MTRQDCDLYLELAELVHANVAGPVRQEKIAKAQRRLLAKLNEGGFVSQDEAEAMEA